MTFPYIPEDRGNEQIYVPRIPITLVNEDAERRLPLQSIVDSGSDDNIFGTDVAEVLGIKYENYGRVEPLGFGGGIVSGHQVPVEIEVERQGYMTDAIFTDAAILDSGIRGQASFLQFFTVSFDDKPFRVIGRGSCWQSVVVQCILSAFK